MGIVSTWCHLQMTSASVLVLPREQHFGNYYAVNIYRLSGGMQRSPRTADQLLHASQVTRHSSHAGEVHTEIRKGCRSRSFVHPHLTSSYEFSYITGNSFSLVPVCLHAAASCPISASCQAWSAVILVDLHTSSVLPQPRLVLIEKTWKIHNATAPMCFSYNRLLHPHSKL